jgi:hypothetical protein
MTHCEHDIVFDDAVGAVEVEPAGVVLVIDEEDFPAGAFGGVDGFAGSTG